MKRYLISNYALRLIELLDTKTDLSWTELSYYRTKLIQEKNKLLRYSYTIPVSEQLELNETLKRIQSSIDKAQQLMNNCDQITTTNFSRLTNRLKQLHK